VLFRSQQNHKAPAKPTSKEVHQEVLSMVEPGTKAQKKKSRKALAELSPMKDQNQLVTKDNRKGPKITAASVADDDQVDFALAEADMREDQGRRKPWTDVGGYKSDVDLSFLPLVRQHKVEEQGRMRWESLLEDQENELEAACGAWDSPPRAMQVTTPPRKVRSACAQESPASLATPQKSPNLNLSAHIQLPSTISLADELKVTGKAESSGWGGPLPFAGKPSIEFGIHRIDEVSSCATRATSATRQVLELSPLIGSAAIRQKQKHVIRKDDSLKKPLPSPHWQEPSPLPKAPPVFRQIALPIGQTVIAKFYGEWYPGVVRSIDTAENSVQVLWDSEYSISTLPPSDVVPVHHAIQDASDSSSADQEFPWGWPGLIAGFSIAPQESEFTSWSEPGSEALQDSASTVLEIAPSSGSLDDLESNSQLAPEDARTGMLTTHALPSWCRVQNTFLVASAAAQATSRSLSAPP